MYIYVHNGNLLKTIEALMELAESDAVWPGRTADERLRRGYVDFVKLCRQQKIRTSVEP